MLKGVLLLETSETWGVGVLVLDGLSTANCTTVQKQQEFGHGATATRGRFSSRTNPGRAASPLEPCFRPPGAAAKTGRCSGTTAKTVLYSIHNHKILQYTVTVILHTWEYV